MYVFHRILALGTFEFERNVISRGQIICELMVGKKHNIIFN